MIVPNEVKVGALSIYTQGVLKKKWKACHCRLYSNSLFTCHDAMVVYARFSLHLNACQNFIYLGRACRRVGKLPKVKRDEESLLMVLPSNVTHPTENVHWLKFLNETSMKKWINAILSTLPDHCGAKICGLESFEPMPSGYSSSVTAATLSNTASELSLSECPVARNGDEAVRRSLAAEERVSSWKTGVGVGEDAPRLASGMGNMEKAVLVAGLLRAVDSGHGAMHGRAGSREVPDGPLIDIGEPEHAETRLVVDANRNAAVMLPSALLPVMADSAEPDEGDNPLLALILDPACDEHPLCSDGDLMGNDDVHESASLDEMGRTESSFEEHLTADETQPSDDCHHSPCEDSCHECHEGESE